MKEKNVELWRAKTTCDIGLDAMRDHKRSELERHDHALYCLLQAVKDIALHLDKETRNDRLHLRPTLI